MRLPWFVRGDVDGFFGLFVDNLVQLLVALALLPAVCGISAKEVIETILPACAISILVGNLFYAWQARQLALKTNRRDVTALPYGINTPSLFAFIFFVMAPVYQTTHDARTAWQAGLFACGLSGVLEVIGAFVGGSLRRHTPRAALLSSLAGIAITFIAMYFVFQVFQSPAVALIPLLLVVLCYAGKVRLPFGFPGGLAAVLVGTAVAWGFQLAGELTLPKWSGLEHLGWYWPSFMGEEMLALAGGTMGWQFLSVIFPMALFNVVGALQNLESAEAAGDTYKTRPSLLVNGAGTIVAALLGSPFPTTIYIGHPGWKAMGARTGYSILNGVAICLICLTGTLSLIHSIIPIEATLGIVLWVGLIITAQAFQTTPAPHALAVAFGLVPALAAWGLDLIKTALTSAGTTLAAQANTFQAPIYIHGMIALSQGYLLTGMIWAATMVYVIEQKLFTAAGWMAGASLLSATGLIHAYSMGAVAEEALIGWWCAPAFTWSYAGMASILLLLAILQRRSSPHQN